MKLKAKVGATLCLFVLLVSACSSEFITEANETQGEGESVGTNEECEGKVPESIVKDWETLTPEEIEARVADPANNPRKSEIVRPSPVVDESLGPTFRVFEASLLGGPATYSYDVWWSGPAGTVWLEALDADKNRLDLGRSRTETAVSESLELVRTAHEGSFNIRTEARESTVVEFELWFEPEVDQSLQRIASGCRYQIVGWFR